MEKVTRGILAIALTAALAAVTPEAMAQEEEEKGSSLFAGFNMTDGNSETLNLSVGAKTAGDTAEGDYFADALFSYGETGDETTTENFAAGAQYNQNLNEDVYGYLAADIFYDDIAAIDYRFTVGPGLGYRLINDDANTWNVEVGAAWVSEDVGGVSDDNFALRAAERSEHALSDTASVYQSVEYLPYFEDFDDYIINAEAGISAEVNDSMSLTAFVINRYDSTPAAGQDENDITVNAGLTYSL